MDVYRIGYRMYSKGPLDGEGSFLYGGRWSSPGTRMAYTSTTLTLAMAEFLAHANIDDFDPDTPPALVYVRVTVPDATVLTIEQIGATLPKGWDDVPAPAVDAAIGDAWILRGQSLALCVPTVHVPIETPERNVLINPLHQQFTKIAWRASEFAYDRRLLTARVAVPRSSMASRSR